MATEHVRWEELAVGYALHALEPADEQAFVRHLAGCGMCERTVAETDGVMTQLAFAAEVETPPDSLRLSILEGIRNSDRPAVFASDPVVIHESRPVEPRRTVTAQNELAARSARRSRLRRWTTSGGAPWAAVAAGLVLVLTLGMWNLVLRADNAAKDTAVARQQTVIKIIQDPATRTVSLAPTSPGVQATAVLNANHLWLLVSGLPANAPATTYVLWRDPGAIDASAVATFNIIGTGLNVVDAGMLPSAELEPVHVLAVTLEQGRTPPPHAGTPLLTGALST